MPDVPALMTARWLAADSPCHGDKSQSHLVVTKCGPASPSSMRISIRTERSCSPRRHCNCSPTAHSGSPAALISLVDIASTGRADCLPPRRRHSPSPQWCTHPIGDTTQLAFHATPRSPNRSFCHPAEASGQGLSDPQLGLSLQHQKLRLAPQDHAVISKSSGLQHSKCKQYGSATDRTCVDVQHVTYEGMLASQLWQHRRVLSRSQVSASVLRIAKRIMREVSSSSSDEGESAGKWHSSGIVQPPANGHVSAKSTESPKAQIEGSKSDCNVCASVLCASCCSPVDFDITSSQKKLDTAERPMNRLKTNHNSPHSKAFADRLAGVSRQLYGLKDRSTKLVRRDAALTEELKGVLDACISSVATSSGHGGLELSSSEHAASASSSVHGAHDRPSKAENCLPRGRTSPGRRRAGSQKTDTNATDTSGACDQYSDNCGQNFTSPRIAARHAAAQAPSHCTVSPTQFLYSTPHNAQIATSRSNAATQASYEDINVSEHLVSDTGVSTRAQTPVTDAATQVECPDSHAVTQTSKSGDMYRPTSPCVHAATQVGPAILRHTPSADSMAALCTDLTDTSHEVPEMLPHAGRAAGRVDHTTVPVLQSERTSEVQGVDAQAAAQHRQPLSLSRESLAFLMHAQAPMEHVFTATTVLCSAVFVNTDHGLDILPIDPPTHSDSSRQFVTETPAAMPASHSAFTRVEEPLDVVSAAADVSEGPSENVHSGIAGQKGVGDVQLLQESMDTNPDQSHRRAADRSQDLSAELSSAPSEGALSSLQPLFHSDSEPSVATIDPVPATQVPGSRRRDDSVVSGCLGQDASRAQPFAKILSAEQSCGTVAVVDSTEAGGQTFLDINPSFSTVQPDELASVISAQTLRECSSASSGQLHDKRSEQGQGSRGVYDSLPQSEREDAVVGRPLPAVTEVAVQNPSTLQHRGMKADPSEWSHSNRPSPIVSADTSVPFSTAKVLHSAGREDGGLQTTPRSRPAPLVSGTALSPRVVRTDEIVQLPCAITPVFISPRSRGSADAVSHRLAAADDLSPVQKVLSQHSTPRSVHRGGAADAAAWVEFGRAAQSGELARQAKGMPRSPRVQLPTSPRSVGPESSQISEQSLCAGARTLPQQSAAAFIADQSRGQMQERRETDDDILQEGNFGKVFKYVLYSNSLYEMDADTLHSVQ